MTDQIIAKLILELCDANPDRLYKRHGKPVSCMEFYIKCAEDQFFQNRRLNFKDRKPIDLNKCE